MKILIGLLTTLICGLSEASVHNFYYGSVHYYSADGAAQMGQTVSLVKRVIDSENGQILETITQPKDKEAGAEDFVTELKLIGGNTFSATDDANSFSGKMIFYGEFWNWNSWDYDLTLRNGGSISGSGFLSSTGIQTNKNLKVSSFQMKIIEDLRVVSEIEYELIHKKLHGE